MRSLIRFLGFVALVFLCLIGIYLAKRHTDRVIVADQPSALRDPSPSGEGLRNSANALPVSLSTLDAEFTALVERVMPSVVSIEAKRLHDGDQAAILMRELFGLGGGGPQIGSGVIVSEEGHIITNLHVIAGTEIVEVSLNDGRKVQAQFLGADPLVDVAVLKVDAGRQKSLVLANSDNVKVGQVVFAIGNPLGLEETVSQGIISGKGRRANQELTTDFLQTDAAINPGNSGGPLVNLHGEVIGINNATALQGQGISFAIPSNIVARVLDDVVKRRRLSRPWFGVSFIVLTPGIAKALGSPASSGLYINGVGRGSPAERAGVRSGDIFVAFNGKPLRDRLDLRNRLAEVKAGDLVNLHALRNGREIDFQIRLENIPMH